MSFFYLYTNCIYYVPDTISLLAFYLAVKAFGREIFVNMGYDLTPGNFSTSFLLRWAENRKIEFDVSWKDVSKACSNLLVLLHMYGRKYF